MNAPEHETMEELAEIALDKLLTEMEERSECNQAWQHWRAFLIQHETQKCSVSKQCREL